LYKDKVTTLLIRYLCNKEIRLHEFCSKLLDTSESPDTKSVQRKWISEITCDHVILPLKGDSLGRDKDPISDIKNLVNSGVGEGRAGTHENDKQAFGA
jgi:hypothetical protein